MVDFLKTLLANFVVMEYKVHSMHTDIVGSLFMPTHLLFGDVYSFFGADNRDKIKERVRILGEFTPSNLSELIDLAEIEEIKKVPSLLKCLEEVSADLEKMCLCLQKGIGESDKDLVTQNLLIDFDDAVGVLKYKVDSILSK